MEQLIGQPEWFFNINVLKWTILNDYYQTGIDGFEIFNAANVTCLYIKQDGSVGIGRYNPSSSYRLTVHGATYLSGNTTVNGTCTATTFSGSGASLASIPYSSLTGVPTIYVFRAGDTISGDLTKNKSNAVLTVSATEENQTVTMFFGTPFQNTGVYKQH